MKEKIKEKIHTTTTFQISQHLHTQVKTMCILTNKTMGEFIRLSLIEKIKSLQEPVK